MRSWRGSPRKQRLSAFLKVLTPRSLGTQPVSLALPPVQGHSLQNHSGIHPLRAFPRLRKLERLLSGPWSLPGDQRPPGGSSAISPESWNDRHRDPSVTTWAHESPAVRARWER